MDIEYDTELLGLLIEGPYFRIVHISIFRRIELEYLGAPFLHPIFQLPDRVLDTFMFDRGDIRLIHESVRIALHNLGHLAVRHPPAGVTRRIHHGLR